MSFTSSYMQAMLWTCKTCGYVIEGGQPHYECPLCESYKTSFIDFPQHLERTIRQGHPTLPPNHRDCRDQRLALIKEHGVDKKRRAAGRILPAASGNHMNPSGEP